MINEFMAGMIIIGIVAIFIYIVNWLRKKEKLE